MNDYYKDNTEELPKEEEKTVTMTESEYNRIVEVMEKMYEELEKYQGYEKADMGKLEKFMDLIGM